MWYNLSNYCQTPPTDVPTSYLIQNTDNALTFETNPTKTVSSHLKGCRKVKVSPTLIWVGVSTDSLPLLKYPWARCRNPGRYWGLLWCAARPRCPRKKLPKRQYFGGVQKQPRGQLWTIWRADSRCRTQNDEARRTTSAICWRCNCLVMDNSVKLSSHCHWWRELRAQSCAVLNTFSPVFFPRASVKFLYISWSTYIFYSCPMCCSNFLLTNAPRSLFLYYSLWLEKITKLQFWLLVMPFVLNYIKIQILFILMFSDNILRIWQ